MKRTNQKRMKTDSAEGLKTTEFQVCIESCKGFPIQRAPDRAASHRGARLCEEPTAIVTAVTGQAAIVQLPLWDQLRRAGPPCDLNTHIHP